MRGKNGIIAQVHGTFVYPDANALESLRSILGDRHAEVARTATEVQHEIPRPGPELARGLPPPAPVQVAAQHVVEQVVPPRNPVEHPTDTGWVT